MITIETMTVTETTTDGDQTTTVIAITMTSIGQTTIMIGMKMIGMTDMIREIPLMIGATLAEDRATKEGITTTIVRTPRKMNRAA